MTTASTSALSPAALRESLRHSLACQWIGAPSRALPESQPALVRSTNLARRQGKPASHSVACGKTSTVNDPQPQITKYGGPPMDIEMPDAATVSPAAPMDASKKEAG